MFSWSKSKPSNQEIRVGRTWGEPDDPFMSWMVASNINDAYYPCNAFVQTDDSYWGIWPKPIGYAVTLPSWMSINDIRDDKVSFKPLPITHERLQEYTSRNGKRATSDELQKIMDDMRMQNKRINATTHEIEVNLEVGLNPAGVRRFFEENIFSEPPAINLTPALLKPYTLQYRMIAANIARANQQKTPKKEQVVPYPVFTGKWHGNTCAGPVFDNMMIPRERGSYPPTFDTTEERNAFFLQICKLLIDGIQKDDGDAKLCENHGNFGECLVGLFDPVSTFACRWFQNNHFLKNRVIILLFHKMVEIHDNLTSNETLDMDASRKFLEHAFVKGASSNPVPEFEKKFHRTFDVKTSRVADRAEQIRIAINHLLEKYMDAAMHIIAKNPLGNDPNPLNTELYSAEYPIPDGKTMAHFLAERHPQLLQQLMEDKQYFNNPTNPIAYLITYATGKSPKGIAIKKRPDMRGTSPAAFQHQIKELRVFNYFNSLPDSQQPPLYVDRTVFEKHNAPAMTRFERFSSSLKSMTGRGGKRHNGCHTRTRRNRRRYTKRHVS